MAPSLSNLSNNGSNHRMTFLLSYVLGFIFRYIDAFTCHQALKVATTIPRIDNGNYPSPESRNPASPPRHFPVIKPHQPSRTIHHTKIFHSSSHSNDPRRAVTAAETPVSGVTLKIAFDQNYAVADLSAQNSERFTSPSSLDMVHRLRRDSDAVLVGRGTVQFDDCSLTVRRVAPKTVGPHGMEVQPRRVVIDPGLGLLSSSGSGGGRRGEFAVLTDGWETIVYYATAAEDVIPDGDGVVLSENVTFVRLPTSPSGHISPRAIIDDLSSRGVRHVMVEGGPATALAFLEEGVVDRAIIVRAPVTFLEPVPSGMNEEMLSRAGLEKVDVEGHSGGDVVEGWCRCGEDWPVKGGLRAWP